MFVWTADEQQFFADRDLQRRNVVHRAGAYGDSNLTKADANGSAITGDYVHVHTNGGGRQHWDWWRSDPRLHPRTTEDDAGTAYLGDSGVTTAGYPLTSADAAIDQVLLDRETLYVASSSGASPTIAVCELNETT
jgi:hypothetical protein